jgi:hypothetical protein
VRERCFASKKKCGSVSLRGCALRTSLQNKTKQNTLSNEEKEGMKEEREKSTEEHEEEEKDTFEIFFL